MQRGHARRRSPAQMPAFNHGALWPAQPLPLNEHETVRNRNAKTEVIEDAMMEMEPVEGLRQLLGVKQESHEYARSPRQ
jgi:hypothetical protein